MVNKLCVLLSIIFLYFIVSIYFKSSEGMCSVDLEDSNQHIDVYYGNFGSIKIRTMSNGDKIIVKVNKRDDYDYTGGKVTLYGPDNDAVVIHRSSEGEYLIVDSNSLEDVIDTNKSRNMIFYGDEGSVVVKLDNNGSLIIVSNTLDLSNINEDSVEKSFYGENGNYIKIKIIPNTQIGSSMCNNYAILTKDQCKNISNRLGLPFSEENSNIYPNGCFKYDLNGTPSVLHNNTYNVNVSDTPHSAQQICFQPELIIVENNFVNNTKKRYTNKNKNHYYSQRKDFIRKTEIVPPVCPTCPSITSCKNINDDEDEDDSGKFSRKPYNNSKLKKRVNNIEKRISNYIDSGKFSRTPVSVSVDNNGTTTVTGSNGGSVVKNSDGTTTVTGPNGGSLVKNEDGVIVAQGAEGGSLIKNEDGVIVAQGAEGGSLIKNEDGVIVARGPEGNTAVRTESGNNIINGTNNNRRYVMRGPQGTYVNPTKVGLYLGDNNIVQSPMPILNNFSTFAR